MSGEVVITGCGVFSAFGFGIPALYEGVFTPRPRFGQITRFDTSPYRAGCAATYAGDGAAIPDLPLSPTQTPEARAVLGACVRDAVSEAGLELPLDAPLLVGTPGDVNRNRLFWQAHQQESPERPDVTASLASELVRMVATDLGLGYPRRAFLTACVASAGALAHGFEIIRTGRASSVICAGAFVVGEEIFGCFDSGMALASEEAVRPFSRGRSGLLIGDGVVALVLEDAEQARRRTVEPLARIAGWGMSSDAHHVVQPHPQGAGLASAAAMALRKAGLAPEQIDYVNAHGTGTKLNDVAETRALQTIFGSHAPAVPVSSTKGSTGHTLEAAGALEVLVAGLALRNGVLPPTAGFLEVDPECDLDYVPNEPRRSAIRYALTMNAAFGGANAAIVLERR